MSVFVIMEEDAFSARVRDIAKDSNSESTTSPGDSYVRRPLRGLQHQKDSHATIRVFRDDGTAVPLVNSSRPADKEAFMTANFLLQSVSMPRQEKLQVIENFGEPFGYFSGARAQFVNFNVMLINSADFNWRSEWVANYENTFRGTRLVELKARMYIFFDDLLVEGYMMNTSVDMTSTDPFLVPCSFSMWVTGSEDLSFVGDTKFPGASPVDPDTGWVGFFTKRGVADAPDRSSFYDNVDEYLQRQEPYVAPPADSIAGIYGAVEEAIAESVRENKESDRVWDAVWDAGMDTDAFIVDKVAYWRSSGLPGKVLDTLLNTSITGLFSSNGANGDTTHGVVQLPGTIK